MFLGPRAAASIPAAADWDARLQSNIAAPLIVAVSGGGDSLALLLMAHAWSARAGRRLIAASVDHGLQAAGAGWARLTAIGTAMASAVAASRIRV